MAATPDVRVRLTAEGVAEVVAAMLKVKTTTEQTAAAASKSFGGLNTVLNTTTRLLSTLGVAVGVGALINVAQNAAKAADTLAETASALGTNVENLQALSAVSIQSGVDVERLYTVLGVTVTKIEELEKGVEGTEQAFAGLGLTLEDFVGLDAAESFVLISQAAGKMEGGINRTQKVAALLGRRLLEVIPVMDHLAHESFAEVIEEGKAMGLILEDEVVEAAHAVADQMTVLNKQAENAAITFVAEMQPALSDTFKIVGDAMIGLGDQFEEFGPELVGVFRAINMALLLLGAAADAVFTLIMLQMQALSGVLYTIFAVLTGNIGTLGTEWSAQLKRMQEQLDAFKLRNKNAGEDFAKLMRGESIGAEPHEAPASTGLTPDQLAALKKKQNADQLALLRALLDGELKLREAQRKAELAQAARDFASGLTTLREFYLARKKIIEDGIADEIATLEKLRAAEIALAPDKASGEAAAAKIDTQIALKRIDGEQQLLDEVDEEEKKRAQLNTARLDAEAAVLEAQGRTHEAAMIGIEQQVAAYEELRDALGVTQSGVSPEDLRSTLTAAAEFDKQLAQFTLELAELDRQRALVATSVQKGLVGELAGEEEIARLEEQRIPALQKIADLALLAAEGTKNEETIEAARAMTVAIAELAAAAEESERLMLNLGKAMQEVFGEELTKVLSGGADGFTSFRDAALESIEAVIMALRRLLSQIIATKILELGAAAGGAAAGGGGGGSEPRLLYATGGKVEAPRPGTPRLFYASGGMVMAGPRAGAPRLRYASGGVVGAPRAGTPRLLVVEGPRAATPRLFYATGGMVEQPDAAPRLLIVTGGKQPARAATPRVLYATGGRVVGPGTGTSDSIRALVDGRQLIHVSSGEHIIRESVASKPGMRQFLDALNAGMSPRAITPPSSGRTRFAEGGPVNTTTTSTLDGTVTVGLEDGLVERAIESKSGQEAILRVLARRSRGANSALGRRG